jgi:hypothetical protein
MATKKASKDLPDPEALADQLDRLAAAMLDHATNAPPGATAARRAINATDAPVRAAAKALHDNAEALQDLLDSSSGSYAEADTDS